MQCTDKINKTDRVKEETVGINFMHTTARKKDSNNFVATSLNLEINEILDDTKNKAPYFRPGNFYIESLR